MSVLDHLCQIFQKRNGQMFHKSQGLFDFFYEFSSTDNDLSFEFT